MVLQDHQQTQQKHDGVPASAQRLEIPLPNHGGQAQGQFNPRRGKRPVKTKMVHQADQRRPAQYQILLAAGHFKCVLYRTGNDNVPAQPGDFHQLGQPK